MLKVNRADELQAHIAELAGTSRWREISQDMIDRFAGLTGDTHWIHTEPERAKAEGPFGGTVAHGFLSLSLLTSSLHDCLEIVGAKRFVNYGLDRVRFTSPVRAGQRLRLALTVAAVEAAGAGATRLRFGCVMEVEGQEAPALRADLIVIAYEG
jgi:acyl dehydratase